MNELNEILNERISIGATQRDERVVKTEEGEVGYYETLGSQKVAFGFNHQLEQETANFNRDDWHGNQFRSASSRNNNNIRAETKNSANSRLSTL